MAARREEEQYHSPLPIDKTIEFANDIHVSFTDNKADFIGYSTKFADPYGDGVLVLIGDAQATVPDSREVDVQKGLTAELEAKMEIGRIEAQKLFRFVEDAFPKSKPKLHEAGQNEYLNARHIPSRLIELLEDAIDFAADNAVALNDKGYSAGMAAGLTTAKAGIQTALKNQNKQQKGRPVKTEERRKIHNLMYDAVRDLCEDAKIIFVNDFAKYNLFLIPGLDTGSVVSGDVLKGKTVNIFQRTLQPTDQFKLESLTNGLLKFCLSPDDVTACSAVGVEVAAGSEVIISASDLGDVANIYLNVTNNDLSNDGKYRVTVM